VDIGVLANEEFEMYQGDHENVFNDATSDSSRSLASHGDQDTEKEFNLNASFTGGYLPNTDISRVDKGQGNP
jgi:hypothetical protein